MNNIRKLTLAGLFCALAVVGSFVSIPVLGSRCAPVQHMVNVIAAIVLGPWFGLGIAFCASLLRNIMGIGSLLAFPGSMFGVFVAGMVFRKTKNIFAACLGEALGTSILGGLCAYPVAVLFMGQNAAEIGFFAYVTPFLISTSVGSIIGGIIVFSLSKSKAVNLSSI